MRRYVGIDPSTKTGFVAMYENGDVVRQKELTGVGQVDPYRMVTLINEIMDHINPGDVVCIESPAMNAQGSAVGFMWGLAYGIRMALFRRGIQYYDVTPQAIKKYIQANGRKDAEGNALKGKAAVAAGVDEHFGYTHPSDNVIDAYVLAEIARSLSMPQDVRFMECTSYQMEVIDTILKPASEKKAEKKAAKKRAADRKAKKAAANEREQAVLQF